MEEPNSAVTPRTAETELLPLPARDERGEGRGEGNSQPDRLSSPQPSPPTAGGEGAGRDSHIQAARGSVPAPTLIHRLGSITERLDVAALFAKAQPLEIEIGSGDGSFLATYAKQHPERNFFGIERLLGRMRKLDRKGLRAGLANLRLLSIEAGYFLKYLAPDACATALHVYFPDPWPKRKHRRHRLINEEFPALARRLLAPGGVVYLRTDDADYFTQMQRVFAAAAAEFEPVETPAELRAVVTDFERTFTARGIETRRAAYRGG